MCSGETSDREDHLITNHMEYDENDDKYYESYNGIEDFRKL